MFVYKDIDKSSTVIQQNVVNHTQNFTTKSLGIKSINIISGSVNNNYWQSLNVLFYTSGSPNYLSESKIIFDNLAIKQAGATQFLSKYHGYPSSSIIQIPQQYIGEKIEEGSFTFTDKTHTDNDGNNPIIKDDGFGNLYSINAHHSQSINNASSSDNYIGNIFYKRGLAVITETGSWSGSVRYSDLADNFTLKFDSQHTITTHEYNVTLLPQGYNLSTNYSLRNVLSGSSEPLTLSTSTLASTFTGSDFQPYISTINLYQRGDYDTPVIQATLPRPIRKSNKINTRFKIKLDL